MKKLLSIIAMSLMCLATWAQTEIEINGIYYNLNDNGTAEVTNPCGGYYFICSIKYTDNITIPSSVTYNNKKYSVTSIGWRAFYDCWGMESVTIPNSVTSIGSEAFYGCFGLTSITIPNSVTSIEDDAFNGCFGLTSITIPNSVTSIGNGVFEGCTGLTSPVYNSHVFAFMPTSYEGAYSIPNGIKTIVGYAFSDCTGLTSIVIPNSVTSIGAEAFSGCTGLTSIAIPNSVTSIGYGAFYACDGLTSPVYNSHVFAYMPTSYAGAYSIPDGIETIASGAFGYISDWRLFGVRGGLDELGGVSVSYTGLTRITIPNSVTSIEWGAFSGCDGLTSPIYNSHLFAYMPTKYQGAYIIPDGIETIADYAFFRCTGLTSITIPNSVTNIGDWAFSECTGLTSPVYNSHVFAYMPTSYEGTYSIPDGIETIAGMAFQECEGLTSIEIPNSVTSIGDLVFEGCTGLTNVTIPNSVTSIGDGAFFLCTGLESVVLGNGVKTINYMTFSGCMGLESITCYSMTPPMLSGDEVYSGGAFEDLPYSTIVYVPADYLNTYKKHSIWGKYDVRPLGAASVQVDDLLITPHYTTIDVTWPSVANAANYEITITSNGIVICKLTFDAQGQLTSISFRAPAAESARAAGQGFQFTVTGLDGCSAYSLTLNAKDASGNVLQTFSQDFTTEGYTAIENVNADGASMKPRKVLEEGRVVILMPDGRKFDTNGRALGK